MFSPEIFRDYDIRGLYGKDFDDEFAYDLGHAIALFFGGGNIAVSMDGRLSSPSLKKALAEGLADAGAHVIDIGLNPTPLLYFAISHLSLDAGVQVTASHLTKEWNGFKINGRDAIPIDAKEGIYKIRELVGKRGSGKGNIEKMDIKPEYVEYMLEKFGRMEGMKVVIDNGNGAVGRLAEEIFGRMGADAETINAEIDGNFPSHVADPHIRETMAELQARVVEKNADIGIAFDGDGDRAGFVMRDGSIIGADKVLMAFAGDALERQKGTVVTEVRASMAFLDFVRQRGGKPVLTRVGHSFLLRKAKEERAVWAGELTGHVYFPLEHYLFDDGIFAAVKMASIMEKIEREISSYPEYMASPEIPLKCSESAKQKAMEKIAKYVMSESPEHVIDIDGIRAEWKGGWLLARPSNTSPKIKIRFEAKSSEFYSRLEGMVKHIKEIVASVQA